jgi:hypothetical protein
MKRAAQDAVAIAGAALIALTACSSGGNTRTGTPTPRKNRNIITADEIATVSASDAFDVVQRLRPSFFATHGQLTPPVAYVDGLAFGELDALHRIQPSSIQSIQYLDPLMATQRFGRAAGGGAILITTKH